MSPNKLFKTFATVSIIGFLAILAFSNWGMLYTLKKYNIEIAERDSISIGYTLFQMERNALINKHTGQLHSTIPPTLLTDFDQRTRALLKPLNIIKIKIFSADTHIIYSTDRQLIGQKDPNNNKLLNALKGVVHPSMQTKESSLDLSHEERFDIDVVETYLPMRHLSGEIIGAYEVYIDITPYREKINDAIVSQITIIVALLFIILSVLALVILRGTKKLNLSQTLLEHKASYDELTDIHNRRHLNKRLNEEFVRFEDAKENQIDYHTGLVLIDIDFFKKINDKHGHLVGDELLIAFAKRLKSTLRNQDIFGRYGGEEFLIILPRCTPSDTTKFAQRARKAVTNEPFPINSDSINISASFGVSYFGPSDSSANDALSRADNALYEVKDNGRDNVATYKPT